MDFQSIKDFPPITRMYLILSILANIMCFAQIIKPIHLFLNFQLIIFHYNFWRLFSHAFFFGQIGIKAFFYIFFFSRYSKALEMYSFQGKKENYLYLLIFGNSIMVLFKLFIYEAQFLGPAITNMIVYLWGKKNAQQQINLVNILHIRGSSLPFVLTLSSLAMKQKTLKLDLLGIIAGHLYYYLEEIYPRLIGGQKVLRTPGFFFLFSPKNK
jgi:Derlin-2/3